MTDYSSEAIAHRLKSVSEARRLGLSLKRAGDQTRESAGAEELAVGGAQERADQGQPDLSDETARSRQ